MVLPYAGRGLVSMTIYVLQLNNQFYTDGNIPNITFVN